MKDFNKVILVGRLGNDPIRRETKSGAAVTQFSLATASWAGGAPSGTEGADRGADRGHEETHWHRIVVWGKLAEACHQRLKKGQTALVDGVLKSRKYKKDDVERWTFEVHAREIIFFGKPGGVLRAVDGADPNAVGSADTNAAGGADLETLADGLEIAESASA